MTDLISDFEMRIPDSEINGPSYLPLLETGELRGRVEALEALLERCTVCPLDCGNNRLAGDKARRRQHLLRKLQPPLCLLSELSDFTGTQRTDQK
jgi:hypothetical protein